jgi:type I restriction enzyme S subunit
MTKGWQTKKLGEVCSLLNRGVSPAYVEAGGVCVLNQKCIRNHEVCYEPSRRHDSKAKKVSAERFIQIGDVLVNSTGTGTLGRVAQVRDEPKEATTVDSHVTIVRPKPGLFYLEFFGYMMVVIEDAIKEAGEGCGGQTELARSVLAERFFVSYPDSLAEQQRIVGLLDEAFAGLASAKANAETNLHNARALFESHLNAVFTQRGEGWVETRIGDAFTTATGTTPPKSNADFYGDFMPLVKPPELCDEAFDSAPDGLSEAGAAVAEGAGASGSVSDSESAAVAAASAGHGGNAPCRPRAGGRCGAGGTGWQVRGAAEGYCGTGEARWGAAAGLLAHGAEK